MLLDERPAMNRADENDSGEHGNGTPASDMDMAYRFLTHHLSTTARLKQSHPKISQRLLHLKESWKRLVHKKSA